ncbi:MAG: hypothetical protein JSW68_10035, partial [Burkholderiales bacterium]
MINLLRYLKAGRRDGGASAERGCNLALPTPAREGVWAGARSRDGRTEMEDRIMKARAKAMLGLAGTLLLLA